MDVILFVLLFSLFGTGIYYLDVLALSKVFTKAKKGILIGRQFQAKIWVATVFVLVKWFIFKTYFHASTDSHFEILYILLEWASVILGFYLAPMVLRMFPGVWRKTTNYINQIEAGKVDPIQDLKNKVAEAGGDVVADAVKGTVKSTITEKKSEPPIESTVIKKEAVSNPSVPKKDGKGNGLGKAVDDFRNVKL